MESMGIMGTNMAIMRSVCDSQCDLVMTVSGTKGLMMEARVGWSEDLASWATSHRAASTQS